MTWAPGELWKSYQYVYTEEIAGTGGPVDYLYCVEAIDKEDADGGRPITPDIGDCTDDTLRTFDCSSRQRPVCRRRDRDLRPADRGAVVRPEHRPGRMPGL